MVALLLPLNARILFLSSGTASIRRHFRYRRFGRCCCCSRETCFLAVADVSVSREIPETAGCASQPYQTIVSKPGRADQEREKEREIAQDGVQNRKPAVAARSKEGLLYLHDL